MNSEHIERDLAPDRRPRVLIVDDEPDMISALRRLLRREPLEVLTAENGARALALLRHQTIDAVLLDIRLPDLSGIEVLRQAKTLCPETPIIMMTGHGTVALAVEALKEGAFEFLTKPFESNDLVPLTLHRAVEYRRLHEENLRLKNLALLRQSAENLAAGSAAMERILRMIPRLAEIDSTVLITGESGVGKEVMARAIHQAGPRARHRFVTVDCGSIPESLMESELFGHLKGSFTGADQKAAGLLKLADQGTVFLDEIGELPMAVQPKLLRFLQDHEVRPLGGEPEKVDVRIMAATNRDLAQSSAEGKFRQDLYYRLNVVNLHLPPLRERKDDIPVLIRHFLDKYGPRLGRKPYLTPQAFNLLAGYEWPGNVRELENVIIQVLSLSHRDQISGEDLPGSIHASPPAQDPPPEDIPLSLEAYEKLALQRALDHCRGSIAEAAQLLNLGKSTLYRKLREHGINPKKPG